MTEALKCGRPLSDVNIVSPLESNGGIPVNVQDQVTRPVDAYFLQVYAPPTTLSAQSLVDTYTITVTDTTGFAAGVDVGLSTGSPTGQYFFGQQVGPLVGNVVTLDTPLDTTYPAGSFAFPANRNLAVNGATTRQIFQVGPIGANVEPDLDLTRVMGYMESGSSMDDSKFGSLPALTNGIVLRRKYNGTYQNFWNAKTNGELSLICASDFYYSSKAPAGFYGARFRATWGGQEKHGVVVRLDAQETLEIVIQDDLTGLSKLNMMAQGHFTQD